MITLKALAEIIENKLNNTGNLTGYIFKIETDTAEIKPDGRNGNDEISYVNGLLRSLSSDVTDLTDGTIIATQNCSLNLIFRLKDEFENGALGIEGAGVYMGPFGEEQPEEGVSEGAFYYSTLNAKYTAWIAGAWYSVVPIERGLSVGQEYEYTIVTQQYEGYKNQIANIREWLNSVLQSSTCETMTDSEGTSFAVTTIYQLLGSGVRDQVQILGDSFVFNVAISYMFVQDGVNSKDIGYYLDGRRIPFQGSTTYRTPSMDGNVYAGSGTASTKNIASQANFSVAIELPALKDHTVTDAIFDFLFGDDVAELNVMHVLRIIRGNKTHDYLVSMGEVNANSETISNVGMKVTLLECPPLYDLITVSSNLYVYEYNDENTDTPNFYTTEDGTLISGDGVNMSILKPNIDGNTFVYNFSAYAGEIFISTFRIDRKDFTFISGPGGK